MRCKYFTNDISSIIRCCCEIIIIIIIVIILPARLFCYRNLWCHLKNTFKKILIIIILSFLTVYIFTSVYISTPVSVIASNNQLLLSIGGLRYQFWGGEGYQVHHFTNTYTVGLNFSPYFHFYIVILQGL